MVKTSTADEHDFDGCCFVCCCFQILQKRRHIGKGICWTRFLVLTFSSSSSCSLSFGRLVLAERQQQTIYDTQSSGNQHNSLALLPSFVVFGWMWLLLLLLPACHVDREGRVGVHFILNWRQHPLASHRFTIGRRVWKSWLFSSQLLAAFSHFYFHPAAKNIAPLSKSESGGERKNMVKEPMPFFPL